MIGISTFKKRFSLQAANEAQHYEQLRASVTDNGRVIYVGALLQRAARLYANRSALIYKDAHISYRDLYFWALSFSSVLREKGVKPRDRVLLFFENSIEFYVGYFAILQLGAIVAPLNTFLKERELAHIVADAKPSLIVASKELAQRIQETNVPGLPEIVTEGAMPLDKRAPDIVPNFQIVAPEENELVALLYTSGTTGLPKGVMLSSKNIMTNVLQGLSRFRFIGEERVFGVLPLFHSFAQNACVWSALFVGCTVILVPRIDRRFIINGLSHKPTVFIGVPALYGLLCLLKTVSLQSVRVFLSGGDALPDKIRMGFAQLYRRKICSGYGLTEASPFLTVDLDDITSPTNTVGTVLHGVSYVLKGEDGTDVTKTGIGELWVKGNNIMLGYYNEPEMTAAVLKDGWLITGDLAYVDQRGKLVISGRLKDLIIHKGFNIYPQEIENVLSSHPNVLRVGVIGRDQVDSGQVPIAYVQLRSKQDDIESELKALCKKELAAYKIPKQFVCIAGQLPTTATGKVDKKTLRREYEKTN